MKANPAGLILWILGASGAFLLYCAVKGYTPQSVLTAFVNRKTAPVPFGHTGTGGGGNAAPTVGLNLIPGYSDGTTPLPQGNLIPGYTPRGHGKP